MNQRIDDLMYHAGLTAQGCWDEMDDYDRRAIERFAELIVRECADYVQFYYKDHACEVIAHDMKTHFGVK